MRKKRKYKIELLEKRIHNKIILSREEFYLLKLFGQYWTENRNSKKLVYYLQFLIKEIEDNK